MGNLLAWIFFTIWEDLKMIFIIAVCGVAIGIFFAFIGLFAPIGNTLYDIVGWVLLAVLLWRLALIVIHIILLIEDYRNGELEELP